MRRWLVLPLLLLALGASDRALWVGPDETYATVGAAVAAARAGDQIFVRAGLYPNDTAHVRVPLSITGVGGFAHLAARGPLANGKAIVIVGADASFTNIEFSGAMVADENGAGIRWEAGSLSVRHCWFHDNETGLLSATIPDGDLVIDHTTFAHNGNFSDQRHNAYVGRVRSVTVTNSVFYDAVGGAGLKSRARRTDVRHSRFIDAPRWDTTGYHIDLPDGGEAIVRDNVFHREATASNRAIIHFGGEVADARGALRVTGNVMQSARDVTAAILNQSAVVVELTGNVLRNVAIPVDRGPARIADNAVDSIKPTRPAAPHGTPPVARD